MRITLPGQIDLPETPERSADLAQRKASAPMLAPVPQKPCDVGLFGDSAAQIDLLDLLSRSQS